ncbi:MAG: hypothetical protein C0490_04300, partial [Marivirga sp.]|nr:hypothetical protein [Marivirga sp.]
MTTQKKLSEILGSFKDNVAIEENGRRLTYSELIDKSTKVSEFLLNGGFSPLSRIGICTGNITDLVISITGTILARCVFVPLDASWPEKRFSSIVQQSNLKAIITSGDGLTEGKSNSNSVLSLKLVDLLNKQVKGNQANQPDYQENDDLYIYFTSGTTGVPKGIVGKNSSLWHFLNWEIETFQIKEGQRFSQLISPYFDAFLRDIFVPLTSGGTICVCPKEEGFLTAEKLAQWIDEQRINLIHCVPSVFRMFNHAAISVNGFQTLKHVLLSGERIIPAELITWYDTFGDRIQLVNLYGATEATLISSYYRIKPEDVTRTKIPIGQPIADTELVIMDKNRKLCKPLIAGDLYIVSNYLSNGYLDNSELMAEKFVRTDEGRWSFRTGDGARILTDGSIDLLGREDRLIKVRGVRIELDEIERVLVACQGVKNAVVLHDKKDDLLIAFVTGDSSETDQKAFTEMAEKHLGDYLPLNMIPSKVIVLNALPLLSNGKIDYQKILESNNTEVITAPADEIERKLFTIWTEILGTKEVSTDKRFNSAGGNSLSIMRLIPRLFSEFGLKITLAELFTNLTIQKQAALIKGKLKMQGVSANEQDTNALIEIEKAPDLPFYSLSSSQKRLYFLNALDSTSLSYNMPQVVQIDGELNKEKLEGVVNKLITRHESLRTVIATIDGNPVQKIVDELPFSIEYFELGVFQASDLITEFIRPFDLNEAPLFRIGLIKISDQSHLLLVDIHHIISDGRSQSVLIKDFMALYNNEQLVELSLQYKDYSEWQQRIVHRKQSPDAGEFWKREFKEEVSVLELPTDYLRPQMKSFGGSNRSFLLDKKVTNRLKALGVETGTTMFMMVLSIFNILLSKLSNQEDITIGTSVEGRYQKDLEGIMGMFVNTLVLRNNVKGDLSFRNFLSKVKNRTLLCFENQSYPYEELIGNLQLARNISRNPLFDVMLVFQNFEQAELIIPGLKLTPYDNGHSISKFDLTLEVVESDEELNLNFEYSTELFHEKTIERFIEYFQRIVAEVTKDADKKLSDINILSKAEQNVLLNAFNNTELAYPVNITFIDLFESKVSECPDNVAVKCGSKSLSYREIGMRSTHL